VPTQIITETEQLAKLRDNKVIGDLTLEESKLIFRGTGNILFCDSLDSRIALSRSRIEFHGDNSLVFLSGNWRNYMLGVTLYNDSVLFFGANSYFNGNFYMTVGERQHTIFGGDSMFSWGCSAQNSDGHLVYDCATRARANPGKSIVVGDHVWLGQGVTLLKGTRLGSGSIVGAHSTVAGKTVPSNTAWSGNPARQKSSGVFFHPSCVYGYEADDTEDAAVCDADEAAEFIFAQTAGETQDIDALLADINALPTADERLKYLQSFAAQDARNRFFIPPQGS
jgi:acetyltransferase-like isoleucine patch superfamily enzyme